MIFYQEMDVGLGIFTITPGRTKVIDYAYPFTFGSYMMFLKRPLSTDYMYFIYPFEAYTWLVIVSIILGEKTCRSFAEARPF